MQYVLEFIKAFLPGFSISIVAGIVSVWIGLVFFWKWRKRDFVKRIEDLIHNVVKEDTVQLRASNKRHSLAIKDFDKRLEVLENEHKNLTNTVNPALDKMSKQINDIYKLLIERR